MIVTLAQMHDRLHLELLDTQWDAELTASLKSIVVRFDHETNRKLAYAENDTFIFDPSIPVVSLPRFPVTTVRSFDILLPGSPAWVPVLDPPDWTFVGGLIAFDLTWPFPQARIARVTYDGGYVFPPDTTTPPKAQLPDDLIYAAQEQVAAEWYDRTRAGHTHSGRSLGEAVSTPKGQHLIPSVERILGTYRRIVL